MEFISNSSQLEVLNGGKCIRNSGFDFWNERLKVLNGVAGRVPVRFLDSFDMEIEIHYRIKKDFEIGTIIFQIGFLPTKHMDKDRFIYDQGLAITALVRENNEVRLVISNFGASMKEERISDNKRDTTFAGRLILRKLKHIISVYLKANESREYTAKDKNYIFLRIYPTYLHQTGYICIPLTTSIITRRIYGQCLMFAKVPELMLSCHQNIFMSHLATRTYSCLRMDSLYPIQSKKGL